MANLSEERHASLGDTWVYKNVDISVRTTEKTENKNKGNQTTRLLLEIRFVNFRYLLQTLIDLLGISVYYKIAV